MSLDNILSSADSGHAKQSSLVPREEPQANGQAAEESDAHAPQEPPRPTSEFQQTVPEPASSLGQPSEQDVASKLPTPTSQTLQADPSFTVTEASQPASQQPPASETAPPLSMDALPDAPAPLPSQLVNHSIPSVTDAQFDSSLPATLDASEQQQAPPRSPFTSGEPTIPADAERVPPTNPQTMPEGSLPQSLASPSLAKRPFEPDTSNPDARDYFGDATEPQVKRQRMSPPVGDSAEAGFTSVEQQQLGTAAVEPSTGAAVGQPAQADADGEKDAEADAEADVDPAVHEPEIQFGTADMGEQPPLPPKLEAGDASMLDQSLDQSMGGGADSFSYESGLQQQGDYADSPMLPPTATTSTGTPADGDFKPPSLPSAPPAPAIMPKEQAKYALSMLRTLKRKSEAGPFLHPVDPVALNIPTYVDIITHPMDLGTVERKIQTGQYKDVDEFASDMRLIWQNCITFNGPDNAVSIWAKTLSTLFEKQIQRMPTLAAIQAEQIAKRSTSPSDSKKSKSGSGSSKPRRPSQAGGSRLSESQRKQQSYEAEYDDYGTAPSTSRPQSGGGGNKKKGKAPQQLQQHQMGMPMGGYGGPAMQNGNLNNEQLKFCKEVIKELFKKQHSAFAYPFYEPVDYMALGIPDYPKVIRRPMDLGTMKRKIESGQYPSAQAFEGDFKLLIQNCFTYNPPMTPVNKMGEQLQAVFYEKWQQLPQQDYNQGYGGGGYYGEENRYENEQIMLMQRQLELLTGNLEMLKSKAIMGGGGMGVGGYGPPGGMGGQRGMQMQMPMQMGMGMPQQSPYLPQQQQQQQHSPVNMMSPPLSAPAPAVPKPRPPPTQRAAPKPAPAKRKTSGSFSSSLPSASAQASAPPKPRTTKRSSMAGRADVDYAPPPRGGRGGDSDYEDEEIDANVTFDMKRELAEKIQEFDGPKLDKVVEIIRNSAPELLGDDNKEIELDIDMLDQRTLLKLYEYVVHPVGKGRQLKPKKNKVKGRNRGVDEVAEEERINALQAQLDAMSGNVANAAAAAGLPVPEMPMPTAGGRAADVASSSSEEDDDGSESESDGFAPSPQ